jgi:hypothetical protein
MTLDLPRLWMIDVRPLQCCVDSISVCACMRWIRCCIVRVCFLMHPARGPWGSAQHDRTWHRPPELSFDTVRA